MLTENTTWLSDRQIVERHFRNEQLRFDFVFAQHDVNAITKVFDCLAENGIVQQFVQITFELGRCLPSFFGIKVNVRFYPGTLFKL